MNKIKLEIQKLFFRVNHSEASLLQNMFFRICTHASMSCKELFDKHCPLAQYRKSGNT